MVREEPSVMLGFVLNRGAEVSYGILLRSKAIDRYIPPTLFSYKKSWPEKTAKKPCKIESTKKRYQIPLYSFCLILVHKGLVLLLLVPYNRP